MPIYVVIDPQGVLNSDVKAKFADADRCRAAPNVWFVRSPRLTSKEVAQDLGIEVVKAKIGIVVRVNHYAGAADRGVVEKLAAWENAE